MKTKTLGCVFVLGLMVSSWGPQAQGEQPAFQFSKPVAPPDLEQEELLAVELDAGVFAATRDGFPDLRLLGGPAEGPREPVPYLLRRVRTTRARTERQTWPARQLAAQPLDGGLEITVQLDDRDPRPQGLRLITPLQNFEQRVRVYSSADGREWEPAGEETVIFDYSQYIDVRSDSVAFPETGRRHIRIVIDDVTVEQEAELLALTRRLRGEDEAERTERVTIARRPFRIERIDFWREVRHERVSGDKKTQYSPGEPRVEHDADNRRTVIEIETQRQPLTAFALVTADRNFSRHAAVEVPHVHGVQRTWRRIGAATLSRIDFKDLQSEELSVSFPETRETRYRLVIDNRDSPPLEVEAVRAEGNVYEIVYLAAPGRSYELVYGAAEAEPAAYDTAAIEELLRAGFDPARAALGAETPGPGFGRRPPAAWSDRLNDPLLLGSIVVLLLIVLGWGLYHAVKRMDKLPSE